MSLKFTQMDLTVDTLQLDLNNPRLYDSKLSGNPPQNEEDLMKLIAKDKELKSLLRSIRKSGVIDPIWVQATDGGKYLVIEGNRRTTCLRMLIEKGEITPGVDFTSVRANVIPKDADPQEVKLQKARLQTGKKVWGAFQVAALIHEFRNEDLMEIEDIAIEMQISKAKVGKYLKTYEMYLKYVQSSGDSNPSRYAMFNEAPVGVLEWVNSDTGNEELYHQWVNPESGTAKIRGAAVKGGLRDFAKVIDDDEALEAMKTIPEVDASAALDIVKENDVKQELPWLNRLLTIQAKLSSLTREQKIRISNEAKVKLHIQSLKAACDRLLQEIEEM